MYRNTLSPGVPTARLSGVPTACATAPAAAAALLLAGVAASKPTKLAALAAGLAALA